jgi:hypothetical protein
MDRILLGDVPGPAALARVQTKANNFLEIKYPPTRIKGIPTAEYGYFAINHAKVIIAKSNMQLRMLTNKSRATDGKVPI